MKKTGPLYREISFIPVGHLKPAGNELDSGAFMRLESAKELSKKEYYDGVLIKVESSSQVHETREQVEKLGLSSSSAQDEIDSVNRIMNGVTLVLAFFSSISLLVGGLMVVNTMVVSVYERTREIGISKALGASESYILRMFLAECLFIGTIGGILGDLFGVLFAALIDRVGRSLLMSRLEIGYRTPYCLKLQDSCSRDPSLLTRVRAFGGLSCREGLKTGSCQGFKAALKGKSSVAEGVVRGDI
ncbi:ABC transporter permease [Methanosarcina sp. 2.H.A.1B.4]|uniref:ABC transporter permease n=1 Tax=Methanosarcina sp. 2.H.A.1B.4 TaxID=1483600 RepID=UPI000B08BD78|nr:ABC transporter permease [Methanosarcina sp. 2.H.A.1B.4]